MLKIKVHDVVTRIDSADLSVQFHPESQHTILMSEAAFNEHFIDRDHGPVCECCNVLEADHRAWFAMLITKPNKSKLGGDYRYLCTNCYIFLQDVVGPAFMAPEEPPVNPGFEPDETDNLPDPHIGAFPPESVHRLVIATYFKQGDGVFPDMPFLESAVRAILERQGVAIIELPTAIVKFNSPPLTEEQINQLDQSGGRKISRTEGR